jgi:predicted transcriptional regulator
MAKRKAAKKPLQPSRISKRVLDVALKELKHVAFESFEWNTVNWAKKAGVSDTTAYNLISGRTRFPRFETVVKMAHAVHVDLVTAERGSVELRAQGAPELKTVVKLK